MTMYGSFCGFFVICCVLLACGPPQDPQLPMEPTIPRVGPLAFQPPQLLELPPSVVPRPGSRYVTAGDLDGNGRSDLAMYDADNRSLFLFYSQPTGGFSAPAAIPALEKGLVPIRSGDLDGDGYSDVVMLPYTAISFAEVHVLLGGPNQRPRGMQSLFPVSPSKTPALADLDQDGRLDVITGGEKGGVSILFYRGQQNGILQFESRQHALMNSTQDITVADLDRDGKMDVLVLGYSADMMTTPLHWFAGRGGGQLAPPVSQNLPGELNRIAIADLDHDGSLDLLTESHRTGIVTRFQRMSDATYKRVQDFTVGKYIDGPLHVADLDNDGWIDAVTLSAGGVAILLNDGHGGFTASTLRFDPMLPAVHDVVIADFNRDTRLDLAAPLNGSRIGLGVLFAQ